MGRHSNTGGMPGSLSLMPLYATASQREGCSGRLQTSKTGKKGQGFQTHAGLWPVSKKERHLADGSGQAPRRQKLKRKTKKSSGMHPCSNPTQPTYPYTFLHPARSPGQRLPARSKSCVDKPGSSGTRLSQSAELNGFAPGGREQSVHLTEGSGLCEERSQLDCF